MLSIKLFGDFIKKCTLWFFKDFPIRAPGSKISNHFLLILRSMFSKQIIFISDQLIYWIISLNFFPIGSFKNSIFKEKFRKDSLLNIRIWSVLSLMTPPMFSRSYFFFYMSRHFSANLILVFFKKPKKNTNLTIIFT